MIRLVFLINSLGGGGAEKVLVNLVNNIDDTKFNITIVTMFDLGVNAQFLNKNIRVINRNSLDLRGMSKIIKFIPSKLLYRYYIADEEYDIAIAYMHGAPSKVLWGAPQNMKKIAWIHSDIEKSSLGKYFLFRNSVKRCFGSFNTIVGVSKTVSESFIKIIGFKEKVVTKYNVNDSDKISRLALEDGNHFSKGSRLINFVAVGRLSPEKGFDRLLNVVSRLIIEGFNFNLYILGDGNERDKLLQLISKFRLQQNVKLEGYKENPYPYLKKANAFICCSLYEGLNTVMSEAMILGTPVLSTDVSGAHEVLGEKCEYGLVVENSENGIYEGMKKILNNPNYLNSYRQKVKERASFFDVGHTVKEIEEMFESILKDEIRCN